VDWLKSIVKSDPTSDDDPTSDFDVDSFTAFILASGLLGEGNRDYMSIGCRHTPI
jgi:hypothetical protein